MPTLWLAESARQVIAAEARRRRVVETGGPLFGYNDTDSGDIIVTEARGPGPRAHHRPWGLTPDRQATQAAIDEVHAASAGSLSYVGEWHTHPGGAPRPSARDVRSAASIASEPEVALSEPVMLIVSTTILRRAVRVRRLAAYRLSARTSTAEPLDITVHEDVVNAATAQAGESA